MITGGAFVPKDKGGAKDGPAPDAVYTGDPQKIWSVNGVSGTTGLQPIFSVKRGQVVVLALRNDTAFPQALHLHGHCFRLLHPLDDGWEPTGWTRSSSWRAGPHGSASWPTIRGAG